MIVTKKKRFGWVVSLLVMLLLSGGVILATAGVDAAVYGKYRESHPVDFTIASTSELAVENGEAYNVLSAEACYDSAGNLVAYAVEAWEYGFNQEEPIVLRSTVSADGTLLVSISVVSQNESQYYGDGIAKESFQSRFAGRLFPVLSSTSSGTGSKVDGLAGATYSTDAVIRAIDDAHRYVTEQLIG